MAEPADSALPPPPPPPTGDGRFGVLAVCDRAYHIDGSGWVLANTFNQLAVEVPWADDLKQLPLPPMVLWVRIVQRESFPDALSAFLFFRTITWNGLPDGKCTAITRVDIQPPRLAIANAEWATRLSRGGFELTPGRKLQQGKNVVVAHFELWCEEKILAFQPLELTYTLTRVPADGDSNASQG